MALQSTRSDGYCLPASEKVSGHRLHKQAWTNGGSMAAKFVLKKGSSGKFRFNLQGLGLG